MTLEELHVSRVPEDLKTRVVIDAQESDSSLNDLVVGILAVHYKVPFVGTGRRSPGAGSGSSALLLRMPDRLRRKIKADVDSQPKGLRSIPAVVCGVLAAHYEKLDRAPPPSRATDAVRSG